MSLFEVSSRYAEALFSLAIKENKLEKWIEEIDLILPFFEENSRLKEVCVSPQINFKIKRELLENCLGRHIDPHLLNFMIYVLKRRRFKGISEIFAGFKRLADQKLGRLTVHLTTAKPIEAESEESLQLALENKFQKKITLKKDVNPDLIAGGILSIGSKRIDSTLQGTLSRLRKHLLKGTSP